MTSVNMRLDDHEARIRELRVEMEELSGRMIALDSEVARLQSLVETAAAAPIQPGVPAPTPPEEQAVLSVIALPVTPPPVQPPMPAAAALSVDEVKAEVPQEPVPVVQTTAAEVDAKTEAQAKVEPEPEPAETDGQAAEQRKRSQEIWSGQSSPHAASAEKPRPAPSAKPEKQPRTEPSLGIEQRLGTNWLVWIGGVALALAGVFLVRYIADQQWLTPTARCYLGVFAGLALVAAGEVIRRRPLQRAIAAFRPDYVPQALTAGGLVTAFGSVYLAHAFYALLGPGNSFILLAAIALSAFLLSVVQGPFVALLGLAGAALTPALVSTETPNPLGFFSYLGVICLAAVAVTHRRHWYWLSELALVAIGGWTAVWMAGIYTVADLPIMGGTLGFVALVTLTLPMRPSPKSDQARLVAWLGLGLAAAAAMVMANRSDIPVSAHWLILIYLAATVAIARFMPRFGLALPAMASLAVVTIGLNYIDNRAIESLFQRATGVTRLTLYLSDKLDRFITHSALVGLLVFAGGLLAMARTQSRTVMALVAAATPLALVAIGYAQFGVDDTDWRWALAAVGVLGLNTLALLYLRRALASLIEVHSIYATMAVAAAFLALTIQFDELWLTLSYAALTLAIALVSRRISLPVLRSLVGLIVLVVMLRLTLSPDLKNYEFDYKSLGQQWILPGFLVPLALFLATARIFKRAADDMTVSVLEGACLTLAVVFVSVEIRILMTGAIYTGVYELPEASLQTISWLTAALVLARRNQRYPRLFSSWGSRILTVAGGVQAAMLQLLRFNPVFTSDLVQGYGIFNILILSLLAPAVLLWLLAEALPARRAAPGKNDAMPTDLLRALSALLVFAFVTEEVRVIFHGHYIRIEHQSLIELYTTTLAWLALGSLPFVLATRIRSEALRMLGGLVLMVAVLAAVLGHAFVYNPILGGDEVVGVPVLNSLILGFFLPAAVLYWAGTRLDKPFQTPAIVGSYILVFVGVWLEVRQGFQGRRLGLEPDSLTELYITTLAWLGLAALSLYVRRIGSLRGAETAGHAALGVSLLALFLGHGYVYNPALVYNQRTYVRGIAILNDLQLGFILPALILALLSRRTWPRTRTWLQIAAYLLMFVGVTLLVKQVFQPYGMTLAALGEGEKYAYSAVWLVLGIVTMGLSIWWQSPHGRYTALTVLVLVVAKVFLIDVMQLGGLWRVVSLFGLGLSLVGIGWIYQRFVNAARVQPAGKAPPHTAKES